MSEVILDDTDRAIVNALQGGFEIVERPFREAAGRLDLGEDDLIERLQRLVDDRALSRFGPMYNAEKLGGGVTLCAMAVPDERFEEVADLVNANREVAHNYARSHELNMWFVLACETVDEISDVIARIERDTGLDVHNFPKLQEFFIGLRVET